MILKKSKKIRQIETIKATGIGHNNPPDSMNLIEEDITDVIDAIDGLKTRIIGSENDYDLIGSLAKKIANFGAKVFIWSGQRLTDFSKSAAVTAGGGFGLWLSGLGEAIVTTLREALRLFLPYLF